MKVSSRRPLPEVYSLEEVARAAGVPVSRLEDLAAAGEIAPIGSHRARSGFLSHADAVAIVHALRSRKPLPGRSFGAGPQSLFMPPASAPRSAAAPIAFSSAVHAIVIAGVVIATSMGLSSSSPVPDEPIQSKPPMRLVYIASPGPGGGGGGGGLRQRIAPPKAERKGKARINSPLPPRKEPELAVAVQKAPEPPPPPLKAEPLPRIVAPVVTAPANDRDRAGVLENTTAKADSRGPGEGGGVGTGKGTGLGEGDGSGIGPGSGGGTGGGPYRPGSGITPPRLLREVKPDYTEEARRQGVEGEVVLEIVVRLDGSVGDIRLLNGLGYGLNDRAIAAVRQWRFSPAHRRGAPVDVLVEVAVEFKLR